jgi:DNA repair protein RadC
MIGMEAEAEPSEYPRVRQRQRSSIQAWAAEDRPREKLIKDGSRGLTATELLAVVLGAGSRSASVVELARTILKGVDEDLSRLSRLNIAELSRIQGVGPAKAATLMAALELGRRTLRSSPAERPLIRFSRDSFLLIRDVIGDLVHEEFWVLYLNRANRMVHRVQISSGGVSGTLVDVKLIFKHALEQLASGIILCHNHPSGNLKPSIADRNLTEKVRSAGKVLDVAVLDHLILAGNSYMSFADEGLIASPG